MSQTYVRYYIILCKAPVNEMNRDSRDLHVGVLIRGNLCGVREVDILPGHEGPVHLLLVDVLDHGLGERGVKVDLYPPLCPT